MRRLFLLACLLATPLAAQEVAVLDGYSDFRMPEARIHDAPMTLVQDLVLNFPGEGEGRPRLDLASGVEDGRLFIEITEDGIADDSTRAIQRRYEFIRTSDGRWALTAYGHRQRCWRGTVDAWTDRPCP